MNVHALRIQFCMCTRTCTQHAYSLCMHGANCARAREHACKLQRASTSYAAAAVIGYWLSTKNRHNRCRLSAKRYSLIIIVRILKLDFFENDYRPLGVKRTGDAIGYRTRR